MPANDGAFPTPVPIVMSCVAPALVAGGCTRKVAEGDDEHKPCGRGSSPGAQRGAVEETLVLRGRLAPPPGGDLPVAAQIAGRVIETRVHEGDRLAKGTVVATVDDLAPRAAAKQAGAALARVKAADVAAQVRPGPRARPRGARHHLQEGRRGRHRPGRGRPRRGRGRDGGRPAGQRHPGRVDVRTTFDGVVTRVFRGAGALVDGTAATPILQIAAVDAVELVADATERELARVREGQKASITLATGATLTGTVIGGRRR